MRPQDNTGVDEPLAELARSQWGVVSLAQLRALGLSLGAVKHRARVGRLRRVYRGVYAIGGAALPREGRNLAAVLACGEGAVLSHVSAAVRWGLLTYDPPRPHVTAPASRTKVPGIRLHRTRSLDARETTTHRGIPITALARTLVDLAASSPKNHLDHAIGQALRNELYDHAAIERVLDGRPGTRALRRATAEDPAFTRSELERRFRALCRRAGLPRPHSNVEVADADFHPHEVDFFFPDHRLIVEVDGWHDHGTRIAFERDRAKDAALVAAGYIVLRFTKRQIAYDPDTVADRVRAGCSRAFASAPARAW
ncbi:MAG TPA: type IV toxin-antitoxin system AbiEi family antitoxin domain-containing protein [Solirubrobacteraceae bacterium]